MLYMDNSIIVIREGLTWSNRVMMRRYEYAFLFVIKVTNNKTKYEAIKIRLYSCKYISIGYLKII